METEDGVMMGKMDLDELDEACRGLGVTKVEAVSRTDDVWKVTIWYKAIGSSGTNTLHVISCRSLRLAMEQLVGRLAEVRRQQTEA